MNHPDDEVGGRVYSEVGPWAFVPSWVLTKKLTPAELVTYIALRSFADRGGDAYPKAETIADRANLAKATVRNAVQSLRKKGLIETAERYRSDGSLAGLDYKMFDIDPSPQQAVEPRRTGEKGGPKPRSAGGTPTDAPPSTDAENTGAGYPTDAPSPASTDGGESTNWCTQEHTREHTTSNHTKSEKSSPAAAVAADSPVSAQTTIDGNDEPLARREPTVHDKAHQIARVWIEYWADPKRNTPISGENVQSRMAKTVIGHLKTGYTEDEVGKALNIIGAPVIPTSDRMQRALAEVRGGRTRTAGRQRQGTGAMAGTNLHVDDLSAEQRRDQNPFRKATRQSDYVTDGKTEQRGAVA